MDILDGNTESMLRFQRFHERLNRSIKMQAIGIELLAESVDGGATASDLKELMYSRNAIWGGMPDWNAAEEDIMLAAREIGQGGVLRAFSAFDLFLIELQAEIDSWRGYIDLPPLSGPKETRCCKGGENEPERLESFYSRLSTSTDHVSHIWPVYQYFRIARNCIAHREGNATQALMQKFESEELTSALAGWMKQTDEMHPPAIVPVVVDEAIAFTHRQAISASSILRHLAFDLGKLVINHLGPEGFVYLVARNAFLIDPPLPETASYATMIKAFNAAIVMRYRARNYDKVEGARLLRKIGLTKRCSSRFANIKKRALAKEA